MTGAVSPAAGPGSAPCPSVSALFGTAAANLLKQLQADPRSMQRARIVGVGGTGKSALAARLSEAIEQAGATAIPLSAVASVDTARGALVVVDDAHRLPAQALELVAAIAAAPQCGLLVVHRPAPRDSGLREVIGTLGPHAVVELGHLTRPAAARRAEALAGRHLSPALAAAIHDWTAGLPALIDLVVRSLTEAELSDGRLPSAIPDEVQSAVAAILAQLPEDSPQAILALRLGAPPDAHTLAQVMDAPDGAARSILAELAHAGLLIDDRVIPVVSDAVSAAMSTGRKADVQRALLGACLETRDVVLARRLSAAGIRHAGLAAVLARAGDQALVGDPSMAAVLYAAAADAGADDVAAAQAEAAFRAGDPAGALAFADHAMSVADAVNPNRAVMVAAAALQQRGLSTTASELYRWLGPERVGPYGAPAALTLYSVGLPGEADAMLAVRSAAPPTVRSSAERLLAEGIRDSMAGHTAAALGSLTSAVSMVETLGSSPMAGDTPAALTALLALNCGEFVTAETVLSQALHAQAGGPSATARHQLLLAWTAMLQGREGTSRELLADVADTGEALAGRDDYFASALRLALARRASDNLGMMNAWPAASQAILRHQVDLYSLMPLGELMVAAARLQESHRLAPALATATAMTKRLGAPTAWTAMLHWSGVQTAVLGGRRPDLAFHVAALRDVARLSQFASTLSSAAQAWSQMMAGEIDPVFVAAAARQLSASGLIWDGSRLAGQAAARTTDRKAMNDLLQCARELQQIRPAPAIETAPRVPAVRAALPPEDAPDGPDAVERLSRLSLREQQVAAMVLEGRTYKEIAEDLFISVRTVEHHVARMRRRVGASNRSDLFTLLRSELAASDPATRRT